MRRPIVVLAFVAALIAGGIAWLMLGRQPADAPAGDGDPPDARPWESVAWSQVQAPFADAGATTTELDTIVVADGRFVAWGRAWRPDRHEGAAMDSAFVSDDGHSWRTALIDDGVADGDTSDLLGIAAGPDGLLAYGSVCCSAESRAAWLSRDGLAWQRLQLVGFDPAAHYWYTVAAAADGWLAVISDVTGRNRLVGSSDGASWSAIAIDGHPTDIAATGDRLVVVGHMLADDGSTDGAVWTSADGVDWTRQAIDDPALVNTDDVMPLGIVAFGGGLFMTGWQSPLEDRLDCEASGNDCGPGFPTAWSSPDGAHWTAVDSGLVEESDHALWAAEASGPGLVGVGVDPMQAGGHVSVWVSADGLEWSPLEVLSDVARDTGGPVAVRGRTLVMVGTHWDVDAKPEPVVWVGTVP